MMINRFLQRPSNWLLYSRYCSICRNCFLTVAFLGLTSQILYDQHPIIVVSIFPQLLLLLSIWYLWRQGAISQEHEVRGMVVFALLIPAMSCLSLLVAWLGWKANSAAIGGIIPISDSSSYYISAQAFLRDASLDVAGQRRPLNIIMTSLWLYLSGDNFKLLLLIQALVFSVVAFLASTVVAALHGFRAGLLLFAFLLVFAEPYLPTTLSETNGVIFGVLALIGFLFALYRRSFLSYWIGAFLLALGLAIRPSALFVLPCIVVAGSVIFRTKRMGRLWVAATLSAAILLPSGISILLNNSMGHRDGALNGNLSYVIYGLVTGGSGWQQYQKDNPGTLDGLPEAERSHVILKASGQHFAEHPVDLVRGLVKGQVLGPLQTFAQITRLAFLGAAGDPLRIIPPVIIMVISLLFAGVLWCQLVAKRNVFSLDGDCRLFCILSFIGYLISIPFFYKDGGLRLHAAVLPGLSYMLVWLLLPPRAASEYVLSDRKADRLLMATIAFGFVLLGALASISLIHSQSHTFDVLPVSASVEENEIVFLFRPGWPQCDLGKFDRVIGDKKPRWFSGAIPDDDYRSAGIKEISGQGHLFFGYDANSRDWKIIHTDQPLGLLNKAVLVPGGRHEYGYQDNKYRDFYSVESVQIIGARSTH